MSTVQELKSLLSENGLWVNKGLGQNFLLDDSVFEKILGAAELKKTDNVVEVGPGTGFLTERLIASAAHVIAIEFDAGMVRLLRKKFRGVPNLTIIHSDVMRFNIGNLPFKKYKLVANIPYYITSPLLKLFLQAKKKPERMVVLVQKEVAEKVCGIGDRGVITLETEIFGKPEIVADVPPGAFWPEPSVDSAILKVEVRKKPLVPATQIDDFMRLIKFGFSMKRKMLSNALSAGLHKKPPEIRELLAKAGVDSDRRAETLEMKEWMKVLKVLSSAQ